MGKVYLNLASGQDYRNGWVNIDNQQMYNGNFKVDKKADIFKLKWKKDSVDFILVNHFIQYVIPEKLDILLKHWYSWLKVDGEIAIEAGNIISVCKHILEAQSIEQMNDKDGIMQLYGVDKNIWNKWAWCPQAVKEAMERVGFRNIQILSGHYHQNPKRDFLIKGKK